MVTPTFADDVELLLTLFEHFWPHEAARAPRGRPFVYQPKALIVFCVVMQQRRTLRFKAQHRWRQPHPALRQPMGLHAVPNRPTLSRRSQDLDPVLQDFLAFLGQSAEDLAPQCTRQELDTAKSLCQAQGPVWHQSDRQAGRMPDKLRHLATEASWSKSGYHGWGDGDGLPLVDHRVGFPTWVQRATAAVAASDVIEPQAPPSSSTFTPLR